MLFYISIVLLLNMFEVAGDYYCKDYSRFHISQSSLHIAVNKVKRDDIACFFSNYLCFPFFLLQFRIMNWSSTAGDSNCMLYRTATIVPVS